MKVIAAIPLLAMAMTMSTTRAEADVEVLKGELGVLEPWVGTWQLEGQWSSGTSLWAQAEYRPLLSGAFLEGRVFVRDGGGELYQRYRTVFAWNAGAAAVDMHTFSHDGAYEVSTLAVDGAVATTEWMAGTTLINERMETDGEGAMRWQVWATPGGGERSQLMDGSWQRVESEPITLPLPEVLEAGVADLDALLGGWEVSSAWSDGSPLWSRVDYRTGLSGRFVNASTWTVDEEGADYQRYETVFAGASSAAGGAVASFSFDGAVATAQWRPTSDKGHRAMEILGQSKDGGELLQEVRFESTTAYRWRVANRAAADLPWQELIDGVWRRQGPDPARPREAIDPDRFVASGTGVRSFAKERVIAAPAAEVFAAWTTSEGWGRLWGPPSASRIELAIGGRYEWMFNGWLGSNGCQVLSFIPDRMVSFSWNAPPSLPNTRLARTWVVVETEAIEPNRTRVRLTHLGFGDGAEWDKTYAYFDSAWERVLELMASALGGEGE